MNLTNNNNNNIKKKEISTLYQEYYGTRTQWIQNTSVKNVNNILKFSIKQYKT